MDTGAFYALVDRADPAHRAAKEFHESSTRPLLTTDFVFAEAMSLVTKRLGKQTAATLGAALRESRRLRIEEPSSRARNEAWKLFSTRPDKDWDLIDCLSFAVMRAYGTTDVFGFDRHFTQAGFNLLPKRT